MRQSFVNRLTLLAALTLTGVACNRNTSPTVLDPALVAGTYVLETVSGRGPQTGQFVLNSTGQAERRVYYGASPSTQAYVTPGTFQLYADGTIHFALNESTNAGTEIYVWHVSGERIDGRFNIQYPDPADGPNIVETYRRQ